MPVDILDIDRIEVVRTPSVVFFGSVAITGVIHIFTQQPQDGDLKVSFGSQAGTGASNLQSDNRDLSMVQRGDVSFGIADKFRFRISGNYHLFSRFQDEYFLLNENRYASSDSLLFFKQNAFETNLNTKLARESLGLNAFVFYKHSENIALSTQLSFQESDVQTVLMDDTLALANRKSRTSRININAHVHGFHLNVSQSLSDRDYAAGYQGNNFRVSQTQVALNYAFNYKKLQILPGIGFFENQHTLLDRDNGLIPDNSRLVGYHAFTKVDAMILPKWRLMASIRGDVYEQTSSPYISYQIGSSFKIKNQLIRASYTYNEGLPLVRRFRQSISHFILPDINPNQIQATELGWNARILSKINTSLEVFHSKTTFSQAALSVLMPSSDILATNQVSFSQIGASVKAQAWFNKIQVEGFITLQRSGETFGDLQSDFLNNTAQFYGGVQLNYTGFLGKLNANIQTYFYEQYQFNTQYGEVIVPSRVLLNLMVSYEVWRENSVFINVRNLLNDNQREYAFGDDVSGMYLLGLKVNL